MFMREATCITATERGEKKKKIWSSRVVITCLCLGEKKQGREKWWEHPHHAPLISPFYFFLPSPVFLSFAIEDGGSGLGEISELSFFLFMVVAFLCFFYSFTALCFSFLVVTGDVFSSRGSLYTYTGWRIDLVGVNKKNNNHLLTGRKYNRNRNRIKKKGFHRSSQLPHFF